MPDGARQAQAPAAIGDKLRFLADPRAYLESTLEVELVETHFSWVFLTDRHAYKLKKPVRGEGFDLRTPEARRLNAVTELRLNRRLAGDVYLRVTPLTVQPNGALALDGKGEPIDWLVQMVRLDADHMLNRRLQRGDWRYAEIEALAARLAAFFAATAPAQVSLPLLIVRIRCELRSALAAAASLRSEPRLRAAMRAVVRQLEAYLRRRRSLLRRRIRERRIVDGHGDLRPEHVCMKGVPRVIDCLEFRPDLRQLDPVSELAYLALECRRLGFRPIERVLLRRYSERTGDRPPVELVRFYAALNAVMRARIAIEHLADPGGRTREELLGRADGYIALAEAHIRFLDP
ncbi:MAG: hypothetical protein ACM3JG_16260 [Thiohalocapsa sp.]